MAYNNDDPDKNKPTPLNITTGVKLTPQSKPRVKYTFKRIHFKDIPVIPFPDGFDPENEEGKLDFFPENAESMICFQKIGDLVDSFVELGYDKTLCVDMIEHKEKNSGFITPAGTIIPQFIYPKNFGLNSFQLVDPEKMAEVEKKYEEANENRTYHWGATKQETKENDSEWLKGAVEVEKNYGVKYPVSNFSNYISILGANPFMDKETFKREYTCNFPQTSVFALLLENHVSLLDKEDEESQKKPCDVTFTFQNTDNGSGDSNASEQDTIEMKVVPDGDITLRINQSSPVSGSLTFNQIGTKIEHGKSVIFFYSLMNSLIATGAPVPRRDEKPSFIMANKVDDLDIQTIFVPSPDRFPALHKDGEHKSMKLVSTKDYPNFGNQVKAVWNNCIGNFAFAALRFCPVVSFSYFYKLSGPQDHTNDGETGIEDYFCLITGGRNPNYQNLDITFPSKKIKYDEASQTSIFRVDFKFAINDPTQLQLHPMELFGIIHVTKDESEFKDILNGDNDFKEFDINVKEELYKTYTGDRQFGDEKWMKFITKLEVAYTLANTTGSITLDKYLMTPNLSDKLKQIVGALTLVAEDGFYRFDGFTKNDEKYFYNTNNYYYPGLPWGQFFRGYGMEIKDDLKADQSDLTIKLYGTDKKLSDIKLINTPYWDGDSVLLDDKTGVLSYFIEYTGCDLQYIPEFARAREGGEEDRLPRSYDWKKPTTKFNLGTSCLTALQEIAKKINHSFIIQPDGRGYFYHMNEHGEPDWIKNGPIRMTYHESDIISLNLAPSFTNRFNTFITLAELAANDARAGEVDPKGTGIGQRFSCPPLRSDDIPWSKVMAIRERGTVSVEALDRFHEINIGFGRARVFTGSITVPGFHGFFLFDKIRIECDGGEPLDFYIHGITQNIDLQSKSWTTSLNVASFELGTTT